jgi:hypothetical protein
MKRLALLAVVTMAWLSALHLFFRQDRVALADGLLARQLAFWAEPGPERSALRRSNPEWDLMGRTFSVLAFTNRALARPEERATLLAATDAIIADALALDEAASDAFVLPYFHRAPFRDPAARSLFTDGELALMLAARQLVEPSPRAVAPLRTRVERIVAQLERAPVLSGESYPDEAWTFCNSIALAALTLADRAGGEDHRALQQRWLSTARRVLVEQKSGLLVSSFTYDGRPLDGPEGSTLWLAAHMLQLVDPDFAKEQYGKARSALVRSALGFAWAREWPADGQPDVDSGPTIPLVEANAGSSGLAFVGAAAFGDDELLDELLTSVAFAGFPQAGGGRIRFAAGNQLADAVILYALVEGPLWERAGAGAGGKVAEVGR